MHQPPTYTTWKIACHSPEEAQALQRWLASRLDLERVFTDTVHAAPNGVEQVQNAPHRLGDFFVEIHLEPASQKNPASFRFWKDLMVNIIQEIETTPQHPSIELESKGESDPTISSAVHPVSEMPSPDNSQVAP